MDDSQQPRILMAYELGYPYGPLVILATSQIPRALLQKEQHIVLEHVKKI
jgi:hypothetical protein